MNKTGWIILIVCLSLALCLCVGLLLAGRLAASLFPASNDSPANNNVSRGYKDLKNAYSASGVYSEKAAELKELTIDWVSGSVVVELTDEASIRFEETAARPISERDALRYSINGGKLRIQACKKNHIGKLPLKNLVVYLPRSLANDLKECEFDLVSASLYLDGISMHELEVNTVSGKIEASNLTAMKAEVETVSGDTVIRDCFFDSLRMDTVSGLMSVQGKIQKVKASSVSGSLQLFLEESKEIRTNTMSGNVTLEFSKAPQKLRVDTASGLTSITLPQEPSCAIRLDSLSGRLLLNMEEVPSKKIILGDGEAEFDIDSVSGDVWVHVK